MWCSPRRQELENRDFPGEEKELVPKIRGIMLCFRLLCHSVLRGGEGRRFWGVGHPDASPVAQVPPWLITSKGSAVGMEQGVVAASQKANRSLSPMCSGVKDPAWGVWYCTDPKAHSPVPEHPTSYSGEVK